MWGFCPTSPKFGSKWGLTSRKTLHLPCPTQTLPNAQFGLKQGKKTHQILGMMREKNLKFGGKLHKKGKPPRFGVGWGGRELEKIKTFGHKKCLKYNIWEEKGIKSQNLGGKRGQKPQKWGGEKSKKSEIWEEKILNFCPSPNNEENQEKTGNEASPLFPHSPAPELLNSQDPAGTECFSPNHSFYT